MRRLRSAILGLSTLSVVYACTPTFQTTEQLCNTYLPTRQAVQSYEVTANEENSEYKLYFEDFLNSLNNLQSKSLDENGNAVLSELSAEEISVRDFILEKAQDEMGYAVDEEGNVASATNPLDFMASLVSAIDADKIVQTFVEAKEQMAQAISKDDGHCTYRNEQIQFVREDENQAIIDLFDATLSLSYIPSALADSNNNVDQTVVAVFDDQPASDDNTTLTYAGADRILPEDFKASGFSPTTQRQINVSQTAPPKVLFLNEDYSDTKLGTFSYAVLNETCTDDTEENNVSTCPAGSITREVAHPSCSDGIDDDGENGNTSQQFDEADETDTQIIHSFTIGDGSNEALVDIKRLRVEVDYPENEIRVYTSKFSTAIYKALDEEGNAIPQGTDNPNPTADQLILDPTRCEEYNVSRDLTELNDNISTAATPYEDPGYEYIEETDENGDAILDEEGYVVTIDPEPLFVFQGTAIPERQ